MTRTTSNDVTLRTKTTTMMMRKRMRMTMTITMIMIVIMLMIMIIKPPLHMHTHTHTHTHAHTHTHTHTDTHTDTHTHTHTLPSASESAVHSTHASGSRTRTHLSVRPCTHDPGRAYGHSHSVLPVTGRGTPLKALGTTLRQKCPKWSFSLCRMASFRQGSAEAKIEASRPWDRL